MNRRMWLLGAGAAGLGLWGAVVLTRQYTARQSAAAMAALGSGLGKLGFSVRCSLAGTGGQIRSTLVNAPPTKAVFGQVLVGRYFVDEAELTQAKAALRQ